MNTKKILVYIDNSNIFINAKQFSGLKKRYPKGVEDLCCRVHVGALIGLACKGREVLKCRLYGSEPPAADTVWKSIEQQKIKVKISKKSLWTCKEKLVDTRLSVDATSDILKYKDIAGDNRTIIIFTGDRDMIPVVEKAQKKGWKVEIWSFKSALSKEFEKRELKKSVLVVYLDDLFEQFTFTTFQWYKDDFPRERSFVAKLEKPINELKTRKYFLKKVTKICSEFYNLPFMGSFINEYDLVLFPCVNQIKGSYDFNKDIWSRIKGLKNFIELCKEILSYFEYEQKTCSDNEFSYDPTNNEESYDGDDTIDIDTYDLELAKEGDFTLVTNKKFKLQKYTTHCEYRFRCKLGSKCLYTHEEKEKEFFKESDPDNRGAYKSKTCYFKSCKWKSKPHMCSYAHGLKEAHCITCKKVGLHWTYQCPD